MSGLGYTLDIAKNAILTNQYGMSVTGHNISNVNTPGYSRQTVLQSSRSSHLTGGLLIGDGVETTEVQRCANQFLENKLMDQQSGLASSQAGSSYMNILESLFNVNSDSSLNALSSEFWNSWHDLANNPSGSAERISIYDSGVRLSQSFNILNSGLTELEADLNHELEAAVDRINAITKDISAINSEIVKLETTHPANDLRDKRNALLTELGQLTDIKSLDQPDGSVTVITPSGYPLVTGAEAYSLKFNAGRIEWIGTQGAGVDITDKINGGKMGGWLDMRDETIPKYKADLDVLAKEMIWEVNQQHSQGVGLNFFAAPVAGTYSTDSSGLLSTLPCGNKIDYSKDFKIWIKDSSTVEPTLSSVEVDMGISDVSSALNGSGDALHSYRFTVTEGGTVGVDVPKIAWEKIDVNGNPQGSGSFDVTALGPNPPTAFDGTLQLDIGAGALLAGNTFTINTDTSGNVDPLNLSSSGRANSVLDTYTFKVKSTADGTTGADQQTGKIGTDTVEIEWSNSLTSGTFALEPTSAAKMPITIEVDGMVLSFDSGTVFNGEAFTISTGTNGVPTADLPSKWHWTLDSFAAQFNREKNDAGVNGISAYVTSENQLVFRPDSVNYSYAFSADDEGGNPGLMAALGINTFFSGNDSTSIAVNSVLEDANLIAAARIDSSTGHYGADDNDNAMAIADVQFAAKEMRQWTFERGQAARSNVVDTTTEGYYNGIVSSIGIKAQNLNRQMEFSQAMVMQLTEQRDSISGVSLDEEMVNMMKYQHAFSVASKLLKVTDEMLTTLIAMR